MRDSILLVSVALLAFGLSLAGCFHFDDYALFNDPLVTSLEATRPLTNLTFQFNLLTSGRDPFGFHLVNLLLHLATVLLLRSTLARAIPAAAALTAALLFAVHPLQTEPVNYIFARGTLLATLLSVAALRAWLGERRWIAVAWFAAALLAKEECVAVPIFLLALNFSLRRDRREWAPIAAMVALSLAAGWRVIAATREIAGTATGFGARTTPLEYLSVEGVAILRYLRLFVWPWGYTVDPALPAVAPWQRLAAWAVVAILMAAALRWFRGARAGFWMAAALILLLPSSSIFPVDDYAADRRMYLPMIALSAGVALLLQKLDRRAMGVLVLLLAAISARYSYVWGTEQRLWQEAVERAPGKARPRLQLARAAATPGEALAILADAERIAPGDPGIASEQGRMLLEAARPAEALAAFGRALALTPGDALALSNRGAALAALGQMEAAQQDFLRALKIDPCQFNARINLTRTGGTVPPLPSTCRYTAEQRAQLRL